MASDTLRMQTRVSPSFPWRVRSSVNSTTLCSSPSNTRSQPLRAFVTDIVRASRLYCVERIVVMAMLARQKVHFGPFQPDPSSGEVPERGRKLSLRWQPIEVLTILPERPLLRTLAVVCFAVAATASITDRVIPATQTPPAQTSTTSCPHPLDKDGNRLWKPTNADLHRIARAT